MTKHFRKNRRYLEEGGWYRGDTNHQNFAVETVPSGRTQEIQNGCKLIRGLLGLSIFMGSKRDLRCETIVPGILRSASLMNGIRAGRWAYVGETQAVLGKGEKARKLVPMSEKEMPRPLRLRIRTLC